VYFTSSKIIHLLVEIYGKGAFFYEIRKTFENDPISAIRWEQKVLRRLRVENKVNWLNRGISGDKPNFYNIGEEPWNKGVPSKIKGSKFYNNGNIAKMFMPGEQPNGWIAGRLNKAWNSGLDATDLRVKGYVEKQKGTKRGPAWNKGKSYEECYGVDRAIDMKKHLSKIYAGKTFEEIHGRKAIEIKGKISKSMKTHKSQITGK